MENNRVIIFGPTLNFRAREPTVLSMNRNQGVCCSMDKAAFSALTPDYGRDMVGLRSALGGGVSP